MCWGSLGTSAARQHLRQCFEHGGNNRRIVVQRERDAQTRGSLGHRGRPDAADIEPAVLQGRRYGHGALVATQNHGQNVRMARRLATARLEFAIGNRDQFAELAPPLRLIPHQRQHAAHDCRHQRRGRRREDKGPAEIDDEVAERLRSAKQPTLRAQGLAAGVQGYDVVAPFQIAGEAAPIWTQNAGRVRLVDNKKSVVAIGDLLQVG